MSTTTTPVYRNSYDETPYESYPFPQSHPIRLRTIGMLFGMHPQAACTARVLEIGCASGGNLVPIAAVFPDSECVGIDASETQIASGKHLIESTGLKNVMLICQDICSVDASLGKFDYIIAHGVYSWIPSDVQRHLLRVCSENLKPQGVAYVSYNTYPGWRLRGMIRDLMIYRGNFFAKPRDKLREGRSLLDFLAKATSNEDSAFARVLADEVEGLRTKQDYYLIHEHLEDVNQPVYFHEFMDRAAAYNLQYLGEAEYSMMLASNFSTDVASMVTRLASAQTLHESDLSTEIDIIQLEQYMDFVRNRLFRQTLLCHREVVLRRPADANSIKSMFVASSATPDAPYVDVQSQESVLFKRPGSTLRTTEPILKAAMLELADQWPQSVSFKDLLRVSRSKIHSAAFLANAATLRAEECKLIDPLMHCFATTHIDLAAERFPFATKVPEFPKTSKLAIYQASHAVAVTNLAHETVHLNDMQRRILVKLTGESDRNGLSLSLMKDVENKELVVQDQGEEVLDMELAKRLVESLIGEELEALTRLKLIYST